MGLSSESQRGDKNESKRIGVGLGLASTLVPAGAGCPAGLCRVKQIDALTKNLFFQGEVCVSPGEIQWPLPKTYFFKGVNYLRMAGWLGWAGLAGWAGWYIGW